MRKIMYLFIILFTLLSLVLNAEDPYLIRENTNFTFDNSITLEDGIVSVWSDTKTSVWNLYAQKVDSSGNKLWNNGQPLLIDENRDNCLTYTRVVKTSDNCIIVAWIKFINPDDYRLYAQKISNSGQLLWSQNHELILESDFYPQFYLIANESDGAYIIYNNSEAHEAYGINLDNNANNLWAANPNPLFSDVSIRDVESDNNGGLIINYNESSDDENLMVARISFDKEILWNEIVALSLPSYYYPEIVAVGSSDFIIWWRWESNVIGQHIDLNGNMYWGSEGMVINNEAVYTNSFTLLSGSNNSFFMAYNIENSPSSDDYTFKILKYDLDGNAIWNDGTELSNTYCWDIKIAPDIDQGCVVGWNDDTSLYVQKVDSDGNKLWGDDGVAFALEYQFEWTQGGFRINELDEQIFCTWQPIQDSKSYLKYQLINESGNLLLPEEGIEIQSGNYSYIDQYQLIGNDESSYCLWEDYRFGKKRIFVQRIAPDGMNYFSDDGIAITDNASHHQENFTLKALPEGGVIVVWDEILENGGLKRVRWQIVNPDGTIHSYNGNNITVDVVYDQTKPQVDIVDGDVNIFWLENESIKAQKLVDYLPVWGNDGSLLIEGGTTDYYRLAGNYFYFNYLDNYYFHHIDENGNLSSNWPYSGVETNTSKDNLEDMIEHDGNLIYTWHNYGPNKIYAFQLLSDTGQYTFTGDGFIISEGEDYYYHDFLFDGYINLFHEDETSPNILMERYDLQGNIIWDNVTIQNDHNYNRLKATKLGENFLVSWCVNSGETSSSYIMRMINSSGNPVQSNLTNNDFLITSDRKAYQIVSITDTDTSILFERGYDVGSKTTFFFSGLVSYQVNISDVPVSEDDIVSSDYIEMSNCPNPFNPETYISFYIPIDCDLNISIYNLKGQLVKNLVDGPIAKGKYEVAWNGDDNTGMNVSSGVYLYVLNVNGEAIQSKKCLLLK